MSESTCTQMYGHPVDDENVDVAESNQLVIVF